MAQPQTWVEALKISSKKLKEWEALAPDGVPVLVYVLQEGHVSADQYLAWASQHYHLPILGEDFFANAFDADNARHLQGVMTAEWKPWLFPVEQWEGVLYVACIEPPETPFNDRVRVVLADPRTLQRCWSLMASSFTATSMKNIVPPLPTPDAVSADEAPIGITTTSKPFKLDLGGLDESQLFSKEAAPAQESAPAFEAPPMPEPMTGSALVEDAESSPLHQMPEPTPAPVPVKAAPAIPDAPAVKLNPVKVAPPPLSKEQGNTNAEEVFEHLKGVYRNIFLMKCSDGKAKLTKWDKALKPKDGKVEVDLAFPTFLRIVSKTHLPYHGYLVDSPAHREFFASLKIDQLPGCVTAIPVNGDNELLGVLVCVGDETLQKLEFLKKTEAHVASLVASLRSAWAAGAAA